MHLFVSYRPSRGFAQRTPSNFLPAYTANTVFSRRAPKNWKSLIDTRFYFRCAIGFLLYKEQFLSEFLQNIRLLKKPKLLSSNIITNFPARFSKRSCNYSSSNTKFKCYRGVQALVTGRMTNLVDLELF